MLVWDEVTCPLGNPAVTFRVRKWVSGYSEELWRAGYREGSAVPLSPAKLVSLLSYLDTQSTRTGISGLDMLASLRDALCYLYCWRSAMRGKEAGKLELSDLYRDRDGEVPVDFPLSLVLPADTLLVVCCHGSKTVRRQLCDPVLFTSGGPHTLDFVARLTFYLNACTQLGFGVTRYMFRPRVPGNRVLAETPYSNSSLSTNLRAHLTAMGEYGGESMHSFRRGMLQTAHAAGVPKSVLQQHAQMKGSDNLEKYLDVERHKPRLARQALSAAAAAASPS